MADRRTLTWGQIGTRWLFIATIVVGFAVLVPRLARHIFWMEYPGR